MSVSPSFRVTEGIPSSPQLRSPALRPRSSHLSPKSSGWERRWEKINLGLLRGRRGTAAENFLLPQWLSVITMTTFSRILGSRCSKQMLLDRLCAVLEQSLLTSYLLCHKG